jgi:hypothetical protein
MPQLERLKNAAKNFDGDKRDFATAAELTKWLMLAVDDGMPVTMLRRDCERIGHWLHRNRGIVENLDLLVERFRKEPSTQTAAGYMFWIYFAIDDHKSREEITTALFELHHWLVQAGRQTHLYFESNHPIGDSI